MEFQENYPVDKLIPYARNSRTHNDEQIAQIAASIKEFGFTNPILIGVDDVIIAGHGRLLAAQRMGLKEVPVIRLPHLTETQRRALVIADNKIALNAGWDEEMLALEMKELGELEFIYYRAMLAKAKLKMVTGETIDRKKAGQHAFNLGRALRDLFSGFSTRYGALIAAELGADEHKTAVVLDEYIRKLLSESRELIDREL